MLDEKYWYQHWAVGLPGAEAPFNVPGVARCTLPPVPCTNAGANRVNKAAKRLKGTPFTTQSPATQGTMTAPLNKPPTLMTIPTEVRLMIFGEALDDFHRVVEYKRLNTYKQCAANSLYGSTEQSD